MDSKTNPSADSNVGGGNSLRGCLSFYNIPRVVLAPNHDLLQLLGRHTGKPAFLMSRGVDIDLFSPSKRSRSDAIVNVGYVGRLSPENTSRRRFLDSAWVDVGRGGTVETIDVRDVVRLMEMEYEELPELKLSFWQAQRLWNLSTELCERALKTLIGSGFLTQSADGFHVRRLV
jgi:hypothetical protein